MTKDTRKLFEILKPAMHLISELLTVGMMFLAFYLLSLLMYGVS